MQKEMIPVTKPYISDNELKVVKEVMESGWLVQGKKVAEFEKAIAEHEQVKYCCATTSCTTALQLTMLAEGMKEGMDVLIPSFTFVATANAVVSTGAVPVIMDVDLETYNFSVESAKRYLEENYCKGQDKWRHKKTGNELWGIVPVHQFGLCADMEGINAIAKDYDLHVIEDAACALGSGIREKHIGGFGHTACISFHPRKSITTGEGGMILTNDEEVYQKTVALRNHGSMINSDVRQNRNGTLLPEYPLHGYNCRMTDIQGAIGCEQVKKLDDIIERRRELANRYDDLFSGIHDKLKIPYVPEGYFHSYQSYVCRLKLSGEVEDIAEIRNRFMEKLQGYGIQSRQGTHAVHKLGYYRKRFGISDKELLRASMCDAATIALPLFVTMTKEEQKYVSEQVIRLLEEL